MSRDWFPPEYLDDVFTEAEGSNDTLANLGPLTPLAGVWEGTKGVDVHPQADGPETEEYLERWEFAPIDRQTNGPQLYYGLRYHTHIHKPGETETFHDQVGYLLWEPATGLVVMTLAIPRAQVAMAGGTAAPEDRRITLSAAVDDPHFGISSAPFLQEAFRTSAWEVTFDFLGEDSFAYRQTTTLHVHGQDAPFAHTDANVLNRVGPAELNPLAGGPTAP
ncbi:MAG: heme-binding beta-barrel domain-containing protein [Candidatus Nanopelagicales bacterium]|nr:heme-binding beta-barrel domain-containing protein [Candidatus Nanopelagicales bacterium]MCF8536564.1 heme-binding beta-barrel domain-containing protein [Candidatus Nanopelagicales bacterium]MCF8543467.1 heme-binding beta-barrel domain-containing protein [Candidatus Nanopelagicales bacterium]MCF8556372.1 heme-binding beta-barrel domain-containing protein [Candidatus Nanopelagicales bacterium]